MGVRQSRVVKKLRAGEIVTCFNVHFDAQASDIAGLNGFDCLWIDREHMAKDWSELQAHIWAARSHNTDVMVRVPRGSYSGYIKPLEMGAAGIMVPHVMNSKEARNVVHTTRFHPVGRRPLDGGNTDGNYAMLDYSHYLEQANDRTFIVLQIEDPEALEELDAIAALEGIDMLFFGPADFSQGIGAPGDWQNPQLLEARKMVAETAAKYGKYAGIPTSIDNLEDMVALGYQFLAIGSDVVAVGNYCRELIAGFKSKVNR